MKERKSTIQEIAKLIDKGYIGENIFIDGLGLSNRDSEYDSLLSYVQSKSFIQTASDNVKIKALILTQDIYDSIKENLDRFAYIIVENPEDSFYQIHELLYKQTDFYKIKIEQTTIGSNCNIHRTVVIEEGVIIGNNVTIGANSVINSNVIIGDNVHIGCCSIIGSEGFQILRNKNGIPYNVKHIGGTSIGDNVWVGDNVTICNSLFEGSVKIGDNCQIDNHTQVAHNCLLGTGCVVTASCVMLGSSELKENCWLAPGSLILNKIVVNKNAFVGANSVVNTNVKSGAVVVGSPAVSIEEFTKMQYQIKKITKHNLK